MGGDECIADPTKPFIRIMSNVLFKLNNTYCGLTVSMDKCQYTVFPIKGKIGRRPTIKLNNQGIKYQNEIKYLGIVIDNKLTWLSHLNEILEKVSKFEFKLKKVVRATWGLRPEIVKNVYLKATERLILYASAVWFEVTVRIKNKLMQIQRKSLLGITKCYCTVATESLQILAGCVPIDLVASMEKKMYGMAHWEEQYDVEGQTLDTVNCCFGDKTNVLLCKEPSANWDQESREEM